MSGLGKGMGSLIASKPPVISIKRDDQGSFIDAREIAVELIDPNPYQPRDTFTHGSMEELTASVKRHGILEPLLVTEKEKGRFELIAGERRLRAAKSAGLLKVPAIVRKAGDLEKLELSIIENLLREDLNPIEEAESFRELVDGFNITQEEVAKRVSKSREAVTNSLRLLALPSEMQRAIANQSISPGHARALLGITDQKAQKALFERIQKEHLTVRDAEHARGHNANTRQSMRDPKLLAHERTLEETLGAKVHIARRGEKGKITIEFRGDEELEEIISRMI